MERIEELISRRPIVAPVIALAALIVFCNPYMTEHVLYDRLAIQGGQWWRIITAPLVHLSASHFTWNLILFLFFGTLLEISQQRLLILITIFTALSTGVIYVVFFPGLHYYGGISGVLTGIVTCLGLIKICRRKKSQYVWSLILILVAVKIVVESAMNEPIFASTEGGSFHVLPSSHLIGATVALFFWFFTERARLLFK